MNSIQSAANKAAVSDSSSPPPPIKVKQKKRRQPQRWVPGSKGWRPDQTVMLIP